MKSIMKIQRRALSALCCVALALAALGGCGSSAEGGNSAELESLQAQLEDMQRELDELKGSQTASEGVPAANANAKSAESTPTPQLNPTNANGNFREAHGALKVVNGRLLDQNDEPVRLYGMSTHGLSWYPQYVTEETFRSLRDEWGINCVRLALYTAENGGYCTDGDQSMLRNHILNGVNHATNLGMYVIVDWHILSEQDPNVYKEQAKEFFDWVSSSYGGYTNVIYEICNEPNGYATWDSVKSYAEEVIPVIRANDPDALILVGTPTWSQDIDKALADPLSFDNVLYTLHFYAATHKDELRSRLKKCANAGLPVFISEFGTCDASGNGGNDFAQTEEWMKLAEDYNISTVAWNLSNKNETSGVFANGCEKLSGWSDADLKESGVWLKNYFGGLSR